MQLLSFALIFTSAFIHASWNTLVRHLKGNSSALILAHFFGAILHLPFVFIGGNFSKIFSIFQYSSLIFLVPSVLSHISYLRSLPLAYAVGDVGLIYPLARGTAIIVASTIAHFYLGPRLSSSQVVGIAVSVIGIVLLAYDASRSSRHKQEEELSRSKISNIVYKELSTVENNIELTAFGDMEDDDSRFYDDEIEDQNRSLNPSSSSSSSSTSSSSNEDPYAKKLRISIMLAVAVGLCTASYSIFDSQGVDTVPPIVWSFWLNIFSSSILLVYLFKYNHEELTDVFTDHLKSVLVLSPSVVGAYLIILYVFSMPDVNVGLVVCLREVSVIIGAVLGVLVLNESYSVLKFAAISTILTGIIMIKIST